MKKTKEVIPFLKCFLHDTKANLVLETIEELLNKYKITAYDIDKGFGIIKHILIRKSFVNQTMLVVFVTNGNLLPNYKKIMSDLRLKHPEVTSFVQNIHHKKTHLVLLEDEKVLLDQAIFMMKSMD